MRSDICSIPVADVFKPKDGCPLCRMKSMLEDRVLTYIMGAAMMEPDIRIQTNKEGFCFDHYKKMFGRRNRLSVALMMESHLAELDKQIFGGDRPALFQPSAGKKERQSRRRTQSCFVCREVDTAMAALLRNTMVLYENDRDFRKLFSEQPEYCLPHFVTLMEAADTQLSKKYRAQCRQDATRITKAALEELHSDVKHFCDMYDYRNNTPDADWGNSKDSLERSAKFLTSRDPETE